jgi:GPH family glycoside/pentoside/hexuronide:cation symporter
LASSYYQTEKLLTLIGQNPLPNNTFDIGLSVKTDEEAHPLFSKTLGKGLHGLCFSPYAEGQTIGDSLSEDQIQRRVNIIAPYVKWVRSFSCTDGNEHTPVISRNHGLQTMVGAWIGQDREKNEREIESLIELAKNGVVDIAVVGNEVLLRGELTENEMLEYIQKVKKALPNIPVGYVDAYYQFYERPALIEACDVLLINCYPFWEGASIESATAYLRQMYALIQQKANGKQVIIAETGWPNQGKNVHQAVPSNTNAMKYFINVSTWAEKENIKIFYFSSFDESWKVHHEGDVGAGWGIWNQKEQLKY